MVCLWRYACLMGESCVELFTFLSLLFTTYKLNQGGWDGWIEEAIEVETRTFECDGRTEETGVVSEMTPILDTLPLYPISYLLVLV